MREADDIAVGHRRLLARQHLERFGGERLIDRAHAVGPLGVTGGNLVIDAGRMGDEESGHLEYVALKQG